VRDIATAFRRNLLEGIQKNQILEVASANQALFASLAPHLEKVQQDAHELVARLTEAMARLPQQAETLAKHGWILPSNFTPRAMDALSQLAEQGGQASLDEWFVTYYSENQDEALDALADQTLNSAFIADWESTLQECIWAYRQGRYALVIPAGLIVVEGLVVSLLGQLGNRAAKNPSRTWEKHSPEPNPDSLSSVFWIQISCFLATVWDTAYFDEPAPKLLNRHYVQHGRQPKMQSRADALRLLVAIGCILDNWEWIVKSEARVGTPE
jgi:hypothetical protein